MKKLIVAFSGGNNIAKEIIDNIPNLEYDKLILSSSYRTISSQIKNKLSQNQYDKIIIFGRLAFATGVIIERFALNITKKNVKITENGNDGYMSTYSLNKLYQFFRNNKIQAKITNYSDSSSCNYAYYQALYLNNTIYNSKIKIVFIHVPPRDERIKQFIIDNIDRIFDL